MSWEHSTEGGSRCVGAEVSPETLSTPSTSPLCGPSTPTHGIPVPSWAPTPAAVPGSEWAQQHPDPETVPSSSVSHCSECRNLLETPADLMPAPKSVPGRRDALDSPGLPAGAGAGASFLQSPRCGEQVGP